MSGVKKNIFSAVLKLSKDGVLRTEHYIRTATKDITKLLLGQVHSAFKLKRRYTVPRNPVDGVLK